MTERSKKVDTCIPRIFVRNEFDFLRASSKGGTKACLFSTIIRYIPEDRLVQIRCPERGEEAVRRRCQLKTIGMGGVHSDTQYPDSSNSIRELSYVDQEEKPGIPFEGCRYLLHAEHVGWGGATGYGTSGVEVVTELSDSMEEPVQFAKLIRCLPINQPGKPQSYEFSMQNVCGIAIFMDDDAIGLLNAKFIHDD